MEGKSKVYWFEPIVFLFFGVFHLHRIWGLINRPAYSNYWISVMNDRGIVYLILMIVLSLLCLMGIITFCKNIGKNPWWRWIYILGGGYVLFDLFAILTKVVIWNKLLLYMFEISNPYWNVIWGSFIIIGFLSLLLGISILKQIIEKKRL